MNIQDWDQSFHRIGTELKKIGDSISPTSSGTKYIKELEQECRTCENRIIELKNSLSKKTDDLRSPSSKLRALAYWAGQFSEKACWLMASCSRIGLKELWLNLFKNRYSDFSQRDSIQDEWVHILTKHKKSKETDSYLSHLEAEMDTEIQRLKSIETAHETEHFNSLAISGMQIEGSELHAAELNALDHLENYLRMVEFMSHRSVQYRMQALDEIRNLTCKVSELLNKCRDLALDTLDFDSDAERIIRKRHFNQYLDKLNVMEHRMEKIQGFMKVSKIKSLHPILKKDEKRANNMSARKYRPRRIEELV